MRVAVAGLGLIGGSVALALARAGHEVIGHDVDARTRRAAAGRFAIAADPRELRESDLVVVAVPARLTAEVAHAVAGPDYAGLVTDVASVKGPVLGDLAAYPRFVGGHPMAGKETAGFDAAEPDLFAGHSWVLCLEAATGLDDWTALARLWTSIGARVVPSTAAAHDRAAARISHVEHLVAAALTRAADEPLARSLAAGSFRDGTRVAASPTALVEGMAAGNREQLLAALDAVGAELAAAREAVAAHGAAPDRLAGWFDSARRLRTSWPPEAGEAAPLALTREGLLRLGETGGWVESIGADEVATVRRPRVKSSS